MTQDLTPVSGKNNSACDNPALTPARTTPLRRRRRPQITLTLSPEDLALFCREAEAAGRTVQQQILFLAMRDLAAQRRAAATAQKLDTPVTCSCLA